MNKIVNFLQKYFAVISVLIGISILLSVTFSSYIVTSNDHKVAEMYIGTLKYSMTIDGSTTNTLSVPSGETIVDITITNENPIDTYYKLIYENNSNVKITYYEGYELDNSNNISNSYDSSNDKILNSGTKKLKLKIVNNSTSQTITFKITGGFATNTLDDVTVPTGYTIIEKDNSTNTYFCTTEDTLTQGLKYVNGQYTYAYKQEGTDASSEIAWTGGYNGWGVQLTDKTSTDAVTSKLCTYINNKPITSMKYMFYKSQATTLDLSSFDTSNVTSMFNMFSNSQATTLDVSKFDTSKVTNMGGMFYYSKATILDVSNFDTSNVTSMSGMFYSTKATTLDVSNFDTSKVTIMGNMFSNSQATTLDVSNFDTSKVTDMGCMFQSTKITTLDLSSFDTSKVTNMFGMFSGSQVTSLDLSSFNTSKVTNMSGMFRGSQATTLDLSNFDTSNVKNMSNMFYGSKTTTIDLSNFNTSKVTDMSYMFKESQVTTLDVSHFDTSKVTNMYSMFYANTNLKTIYASDKFNTDSVTNSGGMFYSCTSLVGGSGTKYKSYCTDKTYAHIDGGTSNPGYFTDINNQPSTFSTDDWTTIISSVKSGNTRGYKVGETKEISLGTTYGTHTLRIANTSTPSDCSSEGFSQSACGFVLEFTDSVTNSVMNSGSTDTNVGGWNSSLVRTLVNGKINNALPSDLKKGIINTTVVSGHGEDDKSNFSATDKLYLLSPIEVWSYDNSDNAIKTDTSRFLTRQLDYYASIGVTTSNYSGAIKKNNPSLNFDWWWLRSAYSKDSHTFFAVKPNGDWFWIGTRSDYTGISPAFRIG